MKKQLTLFTMCFAAALLIGGCGRKVDTSSPTQIAASLLNAYQDQDEKAVLACYGIEQAQAETSEEISFNLQYFKAHKGKKLEITSSDVITQFDGYSYVYAIYNFVLDSGEKAPYEITYLVKNTDGKYTVVPTTDITAELSKEMETAHTKFMDSKEYTSYIESSSEFMEKNPDYESQVYNSLGDSITGNDANTEDKE